MKLKNLVLFYFGGRLGKDGWYTACPSFRVATLENPDRVSKTTYEISLDGKVLNNLTGDNVIENNKFITLSNDGIYDITCYTYSKDGNRSEATTKTVKVDTKAPKSASYTINGTKNPGDTDWYNNEITLNINGLIDNDNDTSGISNLIIDKIDGDGIKTTETIKNPESELVLNVERYKSYNIIYTRRCWKYF